MAFPSPRSCPHCCAFSQTIVSGANPTSADPGAVHTDVWAHTGPPWRGKFASDGFHPGSRGYADWAAAFAEPLALSARTELPR